MNKEELIESGYLEAYLTGDLNTDELGYLYRYLGDTEIQSELREVERKLEFMAREAKMRPSEQVKINLLREILHPKRPRVSYLVAASLVFAILSLGVAIFYYAQYHMVNDQLAAIRNQNTELAENVRQVNEKMNGLQQDLTVLIDPAFKRIILNSTDQSIVRQAVIYFNPSEQRVLLNSSTLPKLSENQQYQLWALIDGQPVDAGVFDTESGRFQKMRPFERVDAFAVTIEPKGGSESPTLESMQVYGEV